METAFSNVACRASSVAVKDRLFTTRVLLAAPATSGTEGQEIDLQSSDCRSDGGIEAESGFVCGELVAAGGPRWRPPLESELKEFVVMLHDFVQFDVESDPVAPMTSITNNDIQWK